MLLLEGVGGGRADIVDAGRRVEWAALFVEMRIGKIGSLSGIEVLYLVLEEFADIGRKSSENQLLLQVVDADIFAFVTD